MAKSKTLELSIKIAGKIDKSLYSALSGTQNQFGAFTTSLSKIGTAGLAAMAALGAGTVKVISDCTEQASQFESYMSDVVKVVDGLADASGKVTSSVAHELDGTQFEGNTYAENYALMTEAILDLSTQIPYTQEELTQLAAAAGQSGKSFTDLADGSFLRDIAMWGTAMDISADQAGDWGAKWEQAFNMNHDQIMDVADVINYLGNNYATTAAEIASSVNDAASLGQLAGVDVSATAAIAASMQAMGVDADRVGTTVKRIYTNITKGETATKAQEAAWNKLGFTAVEVAEAMQIDGTGTLISVFDAINNLPDAEKLSTLNALFGQWAVEGGAKVTQNLDLLTQMLGEVNDPSLWEGSMEKEFSIKASTEEALATMRDSAWQALQIELGDAFLPAKKEFDTAMIEFLNNLRDNMPELTELANTLGSLASQGVTKLGEAMDKALPYIQRGLDYLLNNGDKVASVIGTLAAVFAGMKLAPAAGTIISGAGSLLFGSGGTGATSSGGSGGGLFAGIASLFQKGQTAGSNLGTALNIGYQEATTNPNIKGGFFSKLFTGLTTSGVAAANMGGINSGKAGKVATAWNNVQNAGSWSSGVANAASGLWNTVKGNVNVAAAKASTQSGIPELNILTNLLGKDGRKGIGSGISGLLGSIVSPLKNTATGQYVTNVGSSVGNFFASVSNATKGTTSPLDIAKMGSVKAYGMTAFSKIGNVASSGASVLGSVWGPALSGFGSLVSGAVPVIGAISGIIAIISILGDNLDGIRNIVGNVFGEQGLAVFDSFVGGLEQVGDFINGLFQDGGVAAALAPVQEAITNIFGPEAGAAFSGLTTILQSVMGVIGQIVNFATTTVKPIILEIFNFITQTVIPIILQTFTAAAPYISSIISGLGTAVMTVMQIIGSAIQAAMPFIEQIITLIMNVGSVAIPAILAAIDVFSQGISDLMASIQQIFEGLISFVSGVFTGNWSQAWQGIQDIFGGAFDALITLCKTPINAVISLINSAISGINSLGLTIPDWVPVLGGKSFSINIPTIPMLAKGGFTNGVSIAGEAGTEAVISFQRSVRKDNLRTWAEAGRMLGVQPAVLLDIPDSAGGGGQGGITFAPTIIIQGNADQSVIDEALARAKAEFETWYSQMQRRQARTAY